MSFATGHPVRRLVVALVVSLAGGAAFERLGLPAAWLSGGMAATAVLALAGWDAPVPGRLRDAVYWLLGISMGAGVTPDLVEQLPTWPATLAGLAVSVMAATAASYVFLRRVAGWDPATAYFGSIPGALSMTLATAESSRADLRRVALGQSIRLFMLVAVLPLVLAAVETLPPTAGALATTRDPVQFAALAAAGIAGSVLAARAGIPAGVLLGAFAASGLLHGLDLVEGQLPAILQVPAFAALGAFLGLRFAGTDLRLAAGTIVAGTGAFVSALAAAALGAGATAALVGLPEGQMLVAFAPGGLEAMVILAFVLNVDTTFVAAHHLARFVAMSLFVPVGARLLLGADWAAGTPSLAGAEDGTDDAGAPAPTPSKDGRG